jgi:hypothetical protein
MRSLLTTLLAFAAVLLVAAPARAQSVSRRTQMALWSSGDTGCFTLTVTRDPTTSPGVVQRAVNASVQQGGSPTTYSKSQNAEALRWQLYKAAPRRVAWNQ